MSTGVYTRFQLDPTGTNPDNLVSDEIISLSDRRYRVGLPKHRPFFVESLKLFDGATQQPLTEDQYSIPMISQEATLRFGKEVAESFIIEDSAVSSSVYASYQAVGGLFHNDNANIYSIFETFLNDNRSIDWLTGVYGKPTEYPPGPHPHHVADLFGFETLTFVLERITQAILLGNVPAYEMIFEALTNYSASKADIEQGIINSKLVPLDVLQHATKLYNFNSYKLTPMISSLSQGSTMSFSVTCSYPQSESDQLYWAIEHITTSELDFVLNSGIMTLYRGEGNFVLQSANNSEVNEDRTFQVVFFRGGLGKYELFRSFEITLKKNNEFDLINAYVYFCPCTMPNKAAPSVVSVNRRLRQDFIES